MTKDEFLAIASAPCQIHKMHEIDGVGIYYHTPFLGFFLLPAETRNASPITLAIIDGWCAEYEPIFQLIGDYLHGKVRDTGNLARVANQTLFPSLALQASKKIERRLTYGFYWLDVSPGFVYLIHNPDDGLYKIGFGANPRARARSISKDLTVAYDVLTDYAPQLEAYLHEHFADKREHGEWFRFSEVDKKAAIEIMSGCVRGAL